MTITPSEPDPLVVREGDSVTLRCTVSPSTPLSAISWTRQSRQLSTVTQVPHGLLLSLSSLTKEDADEYTCTVTDTAAVSTSQSIEIRITCEHRVTQTLIRSSRVSTGSHRC